MLQNFVTMFTGLAMLIAVTTPQDAFNGAFAEESLLQNFESLKLGASSVSTQQVSQINEKSRITMLSDVSDSNDPIVVSKSHLTLDLNNISNNTDATTQLPNKRELAVLMRQQFEKFKKSLGDKNVKHSDTRQQNSKFLVTAPISPSFLTKSVVPQGEPVDVGSILSKDEIALVDDVSVNSNVVIGEVVTKSERRAGEEPSGVRSGFLRIDSHPIPVTFTSLPGFPSHSRPGAGTTGFAGATRLGVRAGAPTGTRIPGRRTPSQTIFTSPASTSRFSNVAIDTAFGGQRGSGIRGAGFDRIPSVPGNTFASGVRGVPGIRRQPSRTGGPTLRSGSTTRAPAGGINNGIGNLMRLLESRLIGGIRNTEGRTGIPAEALPAVPSDSPLQQFDPSIVINFLTLVALTQEQRREGFVVTGGESRGPQSQRNASPRTANTDALDGGAPPPSESGFGPFSDGNDPSAGVDPSSIGLPPMLRQTLYSYLLPRLSSLTALVETLPGVPGLDYPIISTVPYTNFYCSSMPWPGFYADTEARCQLWHYCDLEGRQASFLCPNGTIFNQAFFVCDWWYNFDCPSAPYLYSMNERVFAIPEVEETAPHRTLTAEILDTIFL